MSIKQLKDLHESINTNMPFSLFVEMVEMDGGADAQTVLSWFDDTEIH